MKVPSALGVLAWATIQASEAVRLDRSFLSLSAEIQGISEQQGTTRRSLQDALDDLCRIEAQAACRSGLGHYCNATVYARYDGASNNVNSKEWRCYAEDALDFGVARAGCVDTCGRQKMCPGAYNGVAKTYLSRNSQLKGQVDALKAEYCSAPAPTLQEALDRKCAAFGEEACNQGLWAYCDITLYARHDVGNASQKGREWRCFAQDALDFDMSGDGCVDNCGNLISCRGAVNGTSSKHLSRGNEISSVILGDKELYCTESPDSLDSVENPALSKLQGALDGFCAEEGRRACGQGLNAYCNADMFARFDVGTASQQNKEWRCYVKESLDFGMSGEGCVDDCGNFTSCLGAVNGASTTHLTRDAGLRSALAANKDEFCKTESDAPETSEEEEEAVEAPDATTPPSMPPSKLQGALDGFCAEEGRRACGQGLNAYCNADMFARFDVGTASQQNKEWRCYVKESLDFGMSGEGCVDDCGNFTSCLGAVNGASTTHLTRDAGLRSALAANKDEFCKTESDAPETSEEEEEAVEAPDATTPPSMPPSKLQGALDGFCAEEGRRACGQGLNAYCNADMFARFDVGTASQQNKEWRCYVKESLDFGMSGEGCVDDCGNFTSCLGAVNGASTTHLTRDAGLRSALAANKDEFCKTESDAPETSEEEEEAVEAPDATTPPSMPPSKLQGALDGFCAEEGRRACGQGLNAYCNADMFARFDVGTASQQNKEWRCYVKESLDFGMSGEGCVDDCGNFTSCLGAVNGASTTHLTRDAGLRSALAANKDEFCKTESDAPETSEEEEEAVEAPDATTPPSMPPSKLQGALDGFCAEEGRRACGQGLNAYCNADMFARFDVGTASQQNKEWRCYVKESLDFGMSGEGCVDDCGNFTSCLGAVNGASTTHLTRDAGLRSALAANKEEFCKTESDAPETSEEEEEAVEAPDATTPPSMPPSKLQGALDGFCAEEGRRACGQGLNAYCNADMFARFDVGTASQQNKEWRCYVQESLDFDVVGEGCVDDCGNFTSCLGAVNGASTTHLTRDAGLRSALAANKDEFCKTESDAPETSEEEEAVEAPDATTPPSMPPSKLQGALDGFCAEEGRRACGQGLNAYCNADMFARFDVGTASQQNKEWRCYVKESLDFGMSGEGCVDDCGNFTSCLGAVNGASTTHLTRDAGLRSALAANKDEFCKTESDAPETSEEEEAVEAPDATTPPSMPPSKLQGALDGFCAEEGRRACGQGLNAYCNADMFARFDVGTASQQNKEWRCYVKESLDFGMSGEGCVDDCGNVTSCLGAVNGTSTTHLTRDAQVRELIQKKKSVGCTQQGETGSEAPAPGREPEVPAGVPGTETAGKGLKVPPRVPGTGHLQHVLDSQCMVEVAKLCIADESKCDYAVARRVGSRWDCYLYGALDDSHSTDACTDDCGNAITCPGVPKAGDTSVTENSDLNAMAQQFSEATCKMSEKQELRGIHAHQQ